MRDRNSQESFPATGGVREISAWVRKYAKHRRGLDVVVGLLINLAVFGAIAGGAYLGGQALRSGEWALALIGIIVMVAGCIATLFMAFTNAGRNLPARVARRLVRDEGEANLNGPVSQRSQRMGVLMAVAFGTCILGQVVSGDNIPIQYRQPVSALYVVPFLIGIWFLQRPASGYLGLLWPALFSLHAALLLVGAPILFIGRWELMNLLVPVVGYGIITNLLSHLYARFALHKVRQLTTVDMGNE